MKKPCVRNRSTCSAVNCLGPWVSMTSSLLHGHVVHQRSDFTPRSCHSRWIRPRPDDTSCSWSGLLVPRLPCLVQVLLHRRGGIVERLLGRFLTRRDVPPRVVEGPDHIPAVRDEDRSARMLEDLET